MLIEVFLKCNHKKETVSKDGLNSQLYQSIFSKAVEETVLIAGVRLVVRDTLDLGFGIPHGDTDLDVFEHLDVVQPVSVGERLRTLEP